MDMAVASLLKRKIRFYRNDYLGDEPYQNNKGQTYISKNIENAESIGVTDINEMRLKCVEPFVIHSISTIIKEERYHINKIRIKTNIIELNTYGKYYYRNHDLLKNSLDNPKKNVQLFSSKCKISTYPVSERVIKEPFFIEVDAHYIITPPIREWTESTLPEEENQVGKSYREDHCVVCLESKPNILYLDCMHIAVCGSCDRLKKTGRNNCDVCRAEISKRVKI